MYWKIHITFLSLNARIEERVIVSRHEALMLHDVILGLRVETSPSQPVPYAAEASWTLFLKSCNLYDNYE